MIASQKAEQKIRQSLQATATDSVVDDVPTQPVQPKPSSRNVQQPHQVLNDHAEANVTTDIHMSQMILRKPGSSTPSFHGPSPEWLSGKWYITHSTLPTWKDKRNVTITYKMRSPTRLDDTIEFDPIFGGSVKSVSGKQLAAKSVNNHPNPASSPARGSLAIKSKGDSHTVESGSGSPRPGETEQGEIVDWDWHGKGLIKIASAHWEVLGWGGEGGREWVVTYFKNTAMTPEGINIYVRNLEAPDDLFISNIKDALGRVENGQLDKIRGGIFKVQRTM